ncbi:interferon alpha-inducible protein 27, mitochondrial-like [Odontesthes bonariensis]|uniref:interferon alpha-inducible protein 27, mitochondrial-like n=1 Tax=Odontesthes bonariensis TaxID=219752 RepID=UPI003F58C4E2
MADVNIEEVCKAIITIAGGVGAAAMTPGVLAAIGFTSAGIAAGSLAAQLMSYFAIANGGGIVAGSLVAILQSLGTGLSWFGLGAVGGLGSTVGWVLSAVCNQTVTP